MLTSMSHWTYQQPTKTFLKKGNVSLNSNQSMVGSRLVTHLNVKVDGDYLKLPGKVGLIYCKQDRNFEGQIKTVTVSLNPDGKYYASVLVDDGKRASSEISTEGKAIGIDLGLTHFCITSDGSKFDNPRHITKYARNLKKKQQSLARKQKGSKTRYKAKS